MKMNVVTLENLGGGVLAEKFAQELQRVIANIRDPNTTPDAMREISLKVRIKPDSKREMGSVVIESSAKLAADTGAMTQIYFSLRGENEAFEYNPKQEELSLQVNIPDKLKEVDKG